MLRRWAAGQRLSGRVTKLVLCGVFVEVADGIEGLVHLSELNSVPVAAAEEFVQVGDRLTVGARTDRQEAAAAYGQPPSARWARRRCP
ncbi:S1 RNA-binding domain-containing protein [Streptomyces griseorubiginosus]|uniref:S1 RNA-binding domain-containing protein n=1 Tax=Streptomyces griseorubiginosus TaxID=67304 RepID=UPI00369B42BA